MPDRWLQTHNLFSPFAVISTVNEPVRGWIDNVYGPIGMIVGVGSGVLHTFQVDVSNVVDLVPVDLVVNALLCAAHKIGNTTPMMWVSLVIRSKSYSQHNHIHTCIVYFSAREIRQFSTTSVLNRIQLHWPISSHQSKNTAFLIGPPLMPSGITRFCPPRIRTCMPCFSYCSTRYPVTYWTF